MRTRLLTLWTHLQGSYWFLPAVMMAAIIGLSYLTTYLDQTLAVSTLAPFDRLFAGNADAARSALSMIAGSMITVAGVTFSITIVALAQASGQLGPRVLRSFMRDRGNQITLGTFIATFAYCLLALRIIDKTAVRPIPHITMTVAMLLALASLAVLIYFFQHVAMLMQADSVISNVGDDLRESIARLYPDKDQGGDQYELRQDEDLPEDLDERAEPVPPPRSGYLQAVDHGDLVEAASDADALLVMRHHPGHFIAGESELVTVYPGDACTDDLVEAIHEAVVVGTQRIHLQDAEFAVNQLVEIALRALSTGINDPFTAMNCLDQLGSALADLAERTIPSGYHYDEEGDLRLVRDTVTFRDLIDAAFDQIRQNTRDDVAVRIRLLEALAIIAAKAHTEEQCEAISRQADMVWRGTEESIPEKQDREDIRERYDVVVQLLRQESETRQEEEQEQEARQN